MRRLGVGIVVAVGIALGAGHARADDALPPPAPAQGTAPGAVPLVAPPASRMVPVPDVRALTEAQAIRSLEESGLRAGRVERVSVARLEQEFGYRYTSGTVVQQRPPPSTSTRPSWAPRDTLVALRVAWDRNEGTVQPAAPAAPVAPAEPTQPAAGHVQRAMPPAGPAPGPSAPAGTSPPPPPPPYTVPGGAPRAAPQGPVGPALPAAPNAPAEPLPAEPVAPAGAPEESEPCPRPPVELLARIDSVLTLPCERRQGRWHLRAAGGGAFRLGADHGKPGAYGGVDVGYTFPGCVGADLLYRYAGGTFDRLVAGGVRHDGGSWHMIGLKATYQGTFTRNGRLFGWAGLGCGWMKSVGYVHDDSGFAGYAEAGVGFLLSDSARLRLGGMVEAMDTNAARSDPATDGRSRLLWLLAPTLSLELDL